MFTPSPRVLRYARSWISGRDGVRQRELTLLRDGTPIPATLVTPGGAPHGLPVWVVLHGITRPGRTHRQLVRFTRALAEAGFTVIVPEVPEWRALELAPDLTVPTALASLEALEGLGLLGTGEPVGLLGFSFGAPQAIVASADPRLRGRVSRVVGFGGYCDLTRTLLFQFTGEHEYGGLRHTLRPDPYGRWIVGANYLTHIPGMEDAEPVARALRTLAAEAGDAGVIAWDAMFDPTKERLRTQLTGSLREIFHLFAPPTGSEVDPKASRELAHLLAEAARRVAPALEPAPFPTMIAPRIHLLHGRQDHLIPFTQMHHLMEVLPDGVEARATVTGLFGHSAQDPFPGWMDGAREAGRLLRALSQAFELP